MERERAPSNERPTSSNSDVFTLKLSGLPWTATKQQICDFLFGCEVIEGPAGVKIEMNERGKPSGSAFVQVRTKTDVENAMKYNKRMLGKRYVDIEIITTKDGKAVERERYQTKDRSSSSNPDVFTVKLSGLPWTATQQQICDFLFGCEVIEGPAGVKIKKRSSL